MVKKIVKKKIDKKRTDNVNNSKIIREVSKILSVKENDVLKTVEKFKTEIEEMKNRLSGHEAKLVSKNLDKM